MSTLTDIKSKLHEKPNARERIIFFVALVAFFGVFLKACVLESHKAMGEVQEQLDKALTEKTALESQTALIGQHPPLPDKSASPVDQMKWIGSREAADKATDALVKSAQDYGVNLTKFAFPDYREKQTVLFKPVTMTLSGSLGDLGRYLENSEHLDVPLVIENIALEQSADFGDFITLRIEGGFYAER